jgi:hypothetical protein
LNVLPRQRGFILQLCLNVAGHLLVGARGLLFRRLLFLASG